MASNQKPMILTQYLAHKETNRLITALSPDGTRADFARLLTGTLGREIKGNTVRQWIVRGTIPHWARPCIAKLASQRGVAVPADFIEGA